MKKVRVLSILCVMLASSLSAFSGEIQPIEEKRPIILSDKKQTVKVVYSDYPSYSEIVNLEPYPSTSPSYYRAMYLHTIYGSECVVAPELDGCKFNGWWTPPEDITDRTATPDDCSVCFYDDLSLPAEKFISDAKSSKGPDDLGFKILYPQHEYITYQISYGGTYSDLIEYPEKVELPAPTGSPKIGYSYNGVWQMEDSVKTFKVGDIVTGEDFRLNDVHEDGTVIELTPAITANVYKVTYNANGGKFDNLETAVTIPTTYDSNYKIPENPTYADHVFVNWNTKQDGSGDVIGGTTKMSLAYDSEVFAVWSEHIVRTVTLDACGGTVSPATIKVVCGEKYGSLPVPTRVGYIFLGWFSESVGGSEITADTIVVAREDFSIYAHWRPIKYRVEFELNGARGFPPDPIENIEYDHSFTLPDKGNMALDMSLFLGWGKTNKTKTFNAKEEVSNLTTEDGSTVILYAIWGREVTEESIALKCDKVKCVAKRYGPFDWQIMTNKYESASNDVCMAVYTSDSALTITDYDGAKLNGKLTIRWRGEAYGDAYGRPSKLLISHNGETTRLDVPFYDSGWMTSEVAIKDAMEIVILGKDITPLTTIDNSDFIAIDWIKWAPNRTIFYLK